MAKKTNVRWQVLAFLFLISITTYVDRVNVAVAGALMGRELGLARVELGAIFSAFVFGYALFQIPGGWLGDRFGHRRVLAFALVWWSVFTAVTGWIGKSALASTLGLIPAFCVARFLVGVGEAAAYPCSLGLVRRWFPKAEWGRATSVIFGGIGMGSTITPPLVAWLMVNVGWESAFYLSGLSGIVLAFAFWLFVTERPEEHGRVSLREMAIIRGGEVPTADRASFTSSETARTPWTGILKNGELWRLTAISFLGGYVVYIFFFWFYLYLVDVRGFTLLRGSLFAALPFLAMTVGSLISGGLGDYWAPRMGAARARRTVATIGLVPATLFLYLGGTAENAYAAIAALSVAAGLVSLAPSAAWATAMEIDPSRTATVLGIVQTGANLGGAVSPILTPWIAARYGWATALTVGATACLAAALLWKFQPDGDVDPSLRPIIGRLADG
jgi:ACS family glucarate transporter-like MFS transporter